MIHINDAKSSQTGADTDNVNNDSDQKPYKLTNQAKDGKIIALQQNSVNAHKNGEKVHRNSENTKTNRNNGKRNRKSREKRDFNSSVHKPEDGYKAGNSPNPGFKIVRNYISEVELPKDGKHLNISVGNSPNLVKNHESYVQSQYSSSRACHQSAPRNDSFYTQSDIYCLVEDKAVYFRSRGRVTCLIEGTDFPGTNKKNNQEECV